MAEKCVRALRVTPRGVITDVWLPVDTRARLTAMYQHMGCSLVEPVGPGDALTMWCDEEGFFTAHPEANLCAIGIAARHRIIGQPFVGTVLFTGGADVDGATTGLSAAQAIGLRREREHVIRFAVGQRMTRPGLAVRDEVRAVQDECAREYGIGAR